jgi:hypothetical protein
MSVVLMWVAFFGVLQLLGWLFYWSAEESSFPPAPDRHARPTLSMNLPLDN